MSKLVRIAIEQNLEVVNKQLASASAKGKKEYEAEIQELRDALPQIKSAAVKGAVQRNIDALTTQMHTPVKPGFWANHIAELKALKDGYEKVLAVMSNIPWYTHGLRGADAVKPTKVARSLAEAPARKTGVKRVPRR